MVDGIITMENKVKKTKTNIKLYTYISILSFIAVMLMIYLLKTYTINDYILWLVYGCIEKISNRHVQFIQG